jgi:DUF2911 family protein
VSAHSVSLTAAAIASCVTPISVAAAQETAAACQAQGSQQWLSTRASALDSATVTLGNKTAKVCYSRPSARGRTVFGELVPFGKVWRTGANEPTTLQLPVPADVAGVRLPPGRYVLLTVPRPDEWLIIFHRTDETDPVRMFESMVEVARGSAKTERLDTHVEKFTIRGVDGPTTSELLLEWERLRVRVPIKAAG